MEALKARLKQVIIAELHLDGMDPATINDAAPLFGTGLGLDSLDALQLAVAVEENFGVRIENEGEGKRAFASVEALAAYIDAHQTSSSPRA